MKEDTEPKYSLIRLTLQKRWGYPRDSRKESEDKRTENEGNGRRITLFGHYDRLIYENVHNWYALRPAGPRCPYSQNEFNDEYTLRLVAPDCVKEQLHGEEEWNEIFDYSYFDRYATEQDREASLAESSASGIVPLKRFPIFSVLLINCSDQYLKPDSNFQNGFTEIIQEIVEAIRNGIDKQNSCRRFQKLKIGIYLSLGYSDIAVLFSGNSIRDINELIDVVRLWLLGNYASSTYTLLGFEDTYVNTDLSNEIINASIDFSIRPGCRLDDGLDFIGFFVDRKLNGTLETTEKNDNWNQFVQDVPKRDTEITLDQSINLKSKAKEFGWVTPKMLLGTFDWRWEIKGCHLPNFLDAYKNYESEHTRISSFGNDSDIFKTVHTRLLFERSDHIDETNVHKNKRLVTQKSDCNDQSLEEAYKQFVESYEFLIDFHYVHRRPLSAIHEIKALYDRVINSTYGADVKILSQPFFRDFLVIMTQCMKLFTGAVGSSKDRENFLNIETGVDNFLQKQIQDFRNIFETFLFAIYRSDHTFFEGESLLHPSIGSVVKLLFCYNEVLYSWEKKFCEWDTVEKSQNSQYEERSSDFSYLVTSGRTDSTQNGDLFDGISNMIPLDSATKPSRPLIVMMSEAGLYDIEGTLFKLAHEFYHKRGNRMRELRAQAYIRDLSFKVAEKIAYQFVTGWLKGRILRSICKSKEFDNYRIYLNQANFKKFEEWNDKFIKEKNKKALKDLDIYECYYDSFLAQETDFQRTIGNRIFCVLYSKQIQQKIAKDFQVNKKTKWYRHHWREKCVQICQDVWDLNDSNKWTHYSFQSKDRKEEMTLRGKIARVLYECGKQFTDEIFLTDEKKQKVNLLNLYFPIDSVYQDESLYVFDHMEGIKDAIKATLDEESNSYTWEKLAKESFADCLAVKTMIQNEQDPNDPWGKKKGFMSYLRAFLFEVRNPNEKWKIDESRIDPFWVYRIFIAKTLLEWEDAPREDEFKKKIEEWYETYFYPNKHKGQGEYAETVMHAWGDMVNAWHNEYSHSFSDRYQGLIQYLRECIKANKSLCDKLKEVCFPDLRNENKNEYETIEAYTEFMFTKWMNIYHPHRGE